MTVHIEITELGPKFKELVDELAHNGGEACLTDEGKPVGTLHIDSVPATSGPSTEERVFYNGRWMIPAAAERERSIEHLRGSGKVVGDIVSPIDDVEWKTYE
jgi:hypothetical protein